LNKQLTLGKFLHNLTVIFRYAYTHSSASSFFFLLSSSLSSPSSSAELLLLILLMMPSPLLAVLQRLIQSC
jgi:hypothetical protein